MIDLQDKSTYPTLRKSVNMLEIKIRKQKCIFASFLFRNREKYYSYMIDIVPKTEYNVLESEVYSLCI